jgi:phage/plasmid-associated DNA primase
MDTELAKLIEKSCIDVTGNDSSYSHMTHFGPRKRLLTTGNNIQTFWKDYCESVNSFIDLPDSVTHVDFCLAEKPEKIMPIVLDFTFRFQKMERSDEPYHDFLLYVLTFCAQKAILDIYNLTGNGVERDVELICCCLESAQVWEEKNYNNQDKALIVTKIRLQFPYCKVEAADQNRILIPKIIENLRNYNAMSKLSQQPIDDWGKIIGQDTVLTPLSMYGSEPTANTPKMVLNHIFGKIDEKMIVEEEIEQLEIIELGEVFDVKNHTHMNQGLIQGSIFADIAIEHWIPMFLSVGYWPLTTFLKSSGTNATTAREVDFEIGAKSVDETDLQLCQRFLDMISPLRCLEENYWMDVGRALYNSDNGDPGLDIWIKYTLKIGCSKTEDDCRSEWYVFTVTYVTVKTLAFYAREDNKARYKEWHDRWIMVALERALTFLHTDVAVALYRVCWLDYVCCSMSKVKWYHFKNHRMIQIDQGITLRKFISNDFMKIFERMRTSLSSKIAKSVDEAFRATSELVIKKISMLIGKLKTVPYKCSLLKEAAEQFFHEKLEDIADMIPTYLGIQNGVIEILKDRAIFRKGKPEDFITKTTTVPYKVDYTWESPLVVETMSWIGKVFLDQELFKHFLKFSASCLKRMNSDKIFPVFTGEGDNSKSMIVKLFEVVFGSYSIKFPTSLITGKRTGSSAATPELARARAACLGFIQETDSKEEMNGGVVKGFTGGDSYFSRTLFAEGGEVVAMFKLVLMCNKPPIFTTVDRALKARLKIIPFLSAWVKDPPIDLEEQIRTKTFKMDTNFEKRIPILGSAFLWIIVQYYALYVKEGLDDPKIVRDTTDEYFKESDIYNQFSAEIITEARNPDGTRDDKAKLTLTEVYNEFKEFFKSCHPNTPIVNRATVKSELAMRWGKPVSNAWCGIRLINNGVANIGASNAQSTGDMLRL